MTLDTFLVQEEVVGAAVTAMPHFLEDFKNIHVEMIIACHRKNILQVRIWVSNYYWRELGNKIVITELNRSQAKAYILQNVRFISDRLQCASQMPHNNS